MRLLRLTVIIPTAASIGLVLASVIASENALHLPATPKADRHEADILARATDATWRSVQAIADDGITLDAWLFTPALPNHSAVLLLHGIADSRTGMLAHARYLLLHGYTV